MIVEMENAKLIERFNLEYANLMKYFLYVTKSHVEEANVLNDLKNHYSSVIDSARTYDYINTLEDLLRILEKRNALSHDNITPLIYIEARYVRNPKLARSLNDYEKTLGQRPSVPLFNIYDLPGGKYNDEKTDITRYERAVTHETLNDRIHGHTNHNETTIPHCTINMDPSEYCRASYLTAKDTLLDKTECCLHDRSSKIHVPRLDGEYNIFNAREKIYFAAVAAAIFLASLVSAILLTMRNTCPSETPYASRPGVSGIGASNSDDARRPQIRAKMTLYTTEPRFRLTLPGSVEIDPAEQNSDHENEEVARAVFLEVSEKVGRHWRDVARFLGVTEHDIDEIDYHSKLPLKEKAYQALLKFQSKCNPPQWKSKLARALEKARRRDLMEMVEELWSRKY